MKNYNYLKRDSYFDKSRSIFDLYKNLGFDYKDKILKKSISNIYYLDERKERIFNNVFEKFFYYLVEATKTIKKSRNYAIKKDSNKLN